MAPAERLPIPLRETAANRAASLRLVDGAALVDLVQHYDRTVYNVALGLVHNRQDAEDISQEVWIKVANNLANLRNQDRVLPWLYQISRNCSLTFLSSQRIRSHATAFAMDDEEEKDLTVNFPSPAKDSPENQAVTEADRREVWRALMALSESDRQALLLREFQDLPYAEIARMLNISRGNAEVRVFRARRRFRQQFTKQAEGTAFRGLFAFPGLALLAKLKALFGVSVTSAATSGAAAGATAATGGVGAAVGTGLAAQITVGIAAKVAITAIALSAAAGVVAVVGTQVASSSETVPVEARAAVPHALVAPTNSRTAPPVPARQAAHRLLTTSNAPTLPGLSPAKGSPGRAAPPTGSNGGTAAAHAGGDGGQASNADGNGNTDDLGNGSGSAGGNGNASNHHYLPGRQE